MESHAFEPVTDFGLDSSLCGNIFQHTLKKCLKSNYLRRSLIYGQKRFHAPNMKRMKHKTKLTEKEDFSAILASYPFFY